MASILAASFLSQCTGLHYAASGESTDSASANTWGVLLVLLNLFPVVSMCWTLSQLVGPAACQLCPNAAERASARLGGTPSSPGGGAFRVENPLSIAASGSGRGGGEDWFLLREGEDIWYENVATGETSWVLPEGARLVEEPTSPYLPG